MEREIQLGYKKADYKGLFDKKNALILHTLEEVVDFVAEAFGSKCEVALYSLEDLSHAVVKIANGHVTGRKVGSPMTDFGIEMLKEAKSSGKDMVGSHYSQLDDGQLLKSTSMMVRNGQGEPVGMLCINIDLSVPLLDFVRGFLPKSGELPEKIVEHFPATLDELVERTLETVMSRVNGERGISPSDKNKAIVAELCQRRMFRVAGVIDILAKKMGISRYTVYNYIREARLEVGEEE